MMRLWRVVLLVNVALALGVLLGYVAWGRQVARLEEELFAARRLSGLEGEVRTWMARGIVRAVLPESNVVIFTHEDIPGYMPAMTMGFRLHDPRLAQGLDVGATVRFTLNGIPPDVSVTAISREP